MKFGSVAGGLWLITLGAVLMLNTMGIVAWTVWPYLLRWWPVILIAAGLQIALGLRVFPLIMALMVLIGTAVFVLAGQPDPWNLRWNAIWSRPADLQTFKWDQDLPQGVSQARLQLDFGAGRLELAGGGSKLGEGNLSFYQDPPRVQVQQQGNTASIKLAQPSTRGFRMGWTGVTNWSLRLSPGVPWELAVKVGAAEASLDLSALETSRVDVDAGASSLRLVFGSRARKTEAGIKAGASSVELVIPEGVGARIRLDSAISANNLSQAGFTSQGDFFVTANYGSAESNLDITFKGGVSNLKVTRLRTI